MSKGRREPFIAAERMRAYRERRRNGLRCMRILLHETEIDSLISKGFLKKERRHDLNAVKICRRPASCVGVQSTARRL